MSISEDWMDARALGMLSKGLFSCVLVFVVCLLVFLFSWGKAGLAHLQVESVLGQVG